MATLRMSLGVTRGARGGLTAMNFSLVFVFVFALAAGQVIRWPTEITSDKTKRSDKKHLE